jgi:hypothetical protein
MHIEAATGWGLAIGAGAVPVWLIAAGMLEDLVEIIRDWRPLGRPGPRTHNGVGGSTRSRH